MNGYKSGEVVAYTFTPTLGQQRQVDLCELEASLVYGVSSRTAKEMQRNPALKKPKINKTVPTLK